MGCVRPDMDRRLGLVSGTRDVEAERRTHDEDEEYGFVLDGLMDMVSHQPVSALPRRLHLGRLTHSIRLCTTLVCVDSHSAK